MRDFFVVVLTILFLSSCESLLIKDLEIDDTQFEKQVVVQAFVEANSDSIVAFISKNESVLTPTASIKFLEGASVQLFYEGSEIATLEQGSDGRYYHFFDSPQIERGNYEILVTNTPYKDARASTILPEDRSISNLEFNYDVGSDPIDMSTVSEISFVINDEPGRDYYTISFSSIPTSIDTVVFQPGDTIFQESTIFVYPASTQLDPSISTSGFQNDIIISDETFDG